MTVLDDGRVLVTGFEPAPNNGGPTSLTPMLEVFDPTTEKFSPARDLPATVDTALPIRLADGRVLLAGGDGPAVAFDPATGELAEIGGMIRGGYTLAVLLDDGRVLYTGRLGDRDPGASEIYDATKERFLSTGALRTWRENAAVVALEDGRALVFGGDHNFGEAANGEDTIFNSVEAFDPATGAFSAVAPMVRERMELGAERLTDGRILIVGGDVPTSTVELYDPKGTSTEVGPFPGCGDPFSTVRLKDDRVLVACAGPSAIFDPATDTIKPAKLPISIAPTDAVLLADGRVLMVGEDDTALIIQP